MSDLLPFTLFFLNQKITSCVVCRSHTATHTFDHLSRDPKDPIIQDELSDQTLVHDTAGAASSSTTTSTTTTETFVLTMTAEDDSNFVVGNPEEEDSQEMVVQELLILSEKQ